MIVMTQKHFRIYRRIQPLKTFSCQHISEKDSITDILQGPNYACGLETSLKLLKLDLTTIFISQELQYLLSCFSSELVLKKKLLCFIVSYIPPKYRNYKHVSLHFPVKWENSAQKSFLLSTILHRRYFSRLYLEIHNQRWIQRKIT